MQNLQSYKVRIISFFSQSQLNQQTLQNNIDKFWSLKIMSRYLNLLSPYFRGIVTCTSLTTVISTKRFLLLFLNIPNTYIYIFGSPLQKLTNANFWIYMHSNENIKGVKNYFKRHINICVSNLFRIILSWKIKLFY